VSAISMLSHDETKTARKVSRNTYLVLLALVLIITGGVLVALSFQGPKVGPEISGPIGSTTGAPVGQGSSPVINLASATKRHVKLVRVVRSVPVKLSIPTIGISTGLVKLGLAANGDVQVPTSWYTPGWYKLGPTPGQVGSSVILGHVDSVSGPAVFYKLNELRPGNIISVKLADGVTDRFEVTGLRMYSKKAFPTSLVYGSHGKRALNLVTCAGVFDSATHHYLSNLVVFSTFVSSSGGSTQSV
jgi:hypothetical protein